MEDCESSAKGNIRGKLAIVKLINELHTPLNEVLFLIECDFPRIHYFTLSPSLSYFGAALFSIFGDLQSVVTQRI